MASSSPSPNDKTRPMDTWDDISIAQVVVFAIYLVGGVCLCVKHGMERSAGFRFLVILSLLRIVGASMLLASIHDALDESLYIGWAICSGIGFGPLVLMLQGLLGRASDEINRSGAAPLLLRPLCRPAFQLLMVTAMVLIIVGGTRSNFSFSSGSPRIDYNILSRVGVALMIVILAFMMVQLALLWARRRHITPEAHRTVAVVALASPFLVVRTAYAVIVILADDSSSVWYSLGMEVIMEFVIVFIVELVGFWLPRAASRGRVAQESVEQGPQFAKPCLGEPHDVERN